MITVFIRYTLDIQKISDFARYARNWPEIIRRCGGDLVGYFLPTKIAGPTNIAFAVINLPSLAAYEKYRENLGKDEDSVRNVADADRTGCILVEDRTILRKV